MEPGERIKFSVPTFFFRFPRSDQVQGILHSPSKMRAPHGPAGPGIYLSRDYKEAKRHGEVVLKVLAYTGRVKKLDRRTQQPLANIHADSFYYDKVNRSQVHSGSLLSNRGFLSTNKPGCYVGFQRFIKVTPFVLKSPLIELEQASGGGGITVTCLRSEQNLEILVCFFLWHWENI